MSQGSSARETEVVGDFGPAAPTERLNMFVAWRELRFARGRFLLIGSVVTLITLLVGFLGGLTYGLANANISALTSLSANTIVFGGEESVSYSSSTVSSGQVDSWASAKGVDHAEPLGISTVKAFKNSNESAALTVFGVGTGFAAVAWDQKLPTETGHLVFSRAAADKLNIVAGDMVEIAGSSYIVDAVSGNSEYSHTGVVYGTIGDWRGIVNQQNGGAQAPFASVIAVTTDGQADHAAIDTAAGTQSQALLPSLLNLESFKSEIGSLAMMMGMLFGISALVIGAFFTVWTIQRMGDIAVLKALGSSTQRLLVDSLGQALVVLVSGVGVGLLLTVGLGALAANALPFVLSPLTTLLPAVIMIVLGLAGASFALRSVTKVDPLTALSGRNS